MECFVSLRIIICVSIKLAPRLPDRTISFRWHSLLAQGRIDWRELHIQVLIQRYTIGMWVRERFGFWVDTECHNTVVGLDVWTSSWTMFDGNRTWSFARKEGRRWRTQWSISDALPFAFCLRNTTWDEAFTVLVRNPSKHSRKPSKIFPASLQLFYFVIQESFNFGP